MKKVNLDALDAMQRSVEKGGIEYPVRAITNRIASLLDSAAEASGTEKVALYYDAVAKLVPTMPRAEIDDLSIAQLMAVIELASEQIAVVEAAASDPNASSSTETPTPPSPALVAT